VSDNRCRMPDLVITKPLSRMGRVFPTFFSARGRVLLWVGRVRRSADVETCSAVRRHRRNMRRKRL